MHKHTIPSTANGRVPAALYNEDGAKIFYTEDELDAALEEGWVDNPADVGKEIDTQPKPEKKAATPKATGGSKPPVEKKTPALKRKED